jgi:N-acetyl-gamma-glutamyl-phosphate reductase
MLLLPPAQAGKSGRELMSTAGAPEVMAVRVFIDGAAGTTGLEIRQRLQSCHDLHLVTLDECNRKDVAARKAASNEADLVILCLPDAAAREAVSLVENPATRIIDASTAHRVATGWTYGFAELEPARRSELQSARRVSNPGCYATGFLTVVRPLMREKLLPADYPLTCNAVSGYSGGGREMIAEFENENAPNFTREIFRTYGLQLEHKHVPEMQVHSGLQNRPLFAPSVGRFYRGMLVEIPLQLWSLPASPSAETIHSALADTYRNERLIEVAPLASAAGMKTLDAEELKNTDRLKIYIFGNDSRRQARVVASLDNLGKGAAGACVQNLNAMLGRPETAGLVL